MSAQRFQSSGVDVARLQASVEPGLTVGPESMALYIDVTLTDDSLLPDLDVAMAEQSWTFVASSPTTPLPNISTVEVEVDFGTKPVTDAQFSVVVPNALSTSKVIATLSGKTATGRVAGDAQWDGFSFGGNPLVGVVTLYATCVTGSVVGKRVVDITVNNL